MRFFFLIICISAIVAGCTKSGVKPGTTLTGTWELRHYSGTIAGVNTDLPKGNGTLIQFAGDSTFKHFTASKQDDQGTYRVVKDGVTYDNKKYDAIYFNSNADAAFLAMHADSLIIGNTNTYADGAVSTYIRKAN
ncbi:MAG TPA: hypothetical protein VIM55_08535 [Mucilaginibacter sp.]